MAFGKTSKVFDTKRNFLNTEMLSGEETGGNAKGQIVSTSSTQGSPWTQATVSKS